MYPSSEMGSRWHFPLLSILSKLVFKCFFPFSFWKSSLLQPFLNKNPRSNWKASLLAASLSPTQRTKRVWPLNTLSLTSCVETFPFPTVIPTGLFKRELFQAWATHKMMVSLSGAWLLEKFLELISDYTRLKIESLSLSKRQKWMSEIWNLKHNTIYISTPPKKGIRYKNKICIRAIWGKLQNSDELNLKKLNKWRDSPYSWIGRLTIVKMSVLLNLIYRFNTILIKIPATNWF